jgi:type 1 glutamine amidotransferase
MSARWIPLVTGLLVASAPAVTGLGQTVPVRQLLLIGQGPDGHPPGTHEYMAGVRILQKLLARFPAITTTVVKADEPWPEGPRLIDQADGVVMYVTQGARWMQWKPGRYAALERLAGRGGGIVALHWAVGAKAAQYIPGQLALLGGTRGGPQRKYQEVHTELQLIDPSQPILSGLQDFRIFDEFYYRLNLHPASEDFHPLLRARIDGREETVCWAWDRPDDGRSFGFVGLHFHRNWGRPEYRRLVVQGILWTLKLPIPKAGVDVDIDPQALRLK